MIRYNELDPKIVFKYFNEISKIPRCSGNEKDISNYLVQFAKNNNLEYIQDEYNNVIIKKSAYKGYENKSTVIIQGHMDMVCEKTSTSNHDFNKDPIELIIDDDFLKSNNTTLGADNGIAIAYGLAILESNEIEHPNIELFITTEEETGMEGARNLDPEYLKGKILINIDSEEEGKLLVSCAGGQRDRLLISTEKENLIDEKKYKYIELNIEGLKGGHSGLEIHKERANSNKLIGRLLYELNTKFSIKISDISGGSKDNAIPRSSCSKLFVRIEDLDKIYSEVKEMNLNFNKEFYPEEKEISIKIKELNNSIDNKIYTKECSDKILKAIYLFPNGINTMSKTIKGLVESSNNLGVIVSNDEYLELHTAIRSSVDSLREEIHNKISIISELTESKLLQEGKYPSWEYNPNSKIKEICEKTYKRMYNKEIEIEAIHAGLECGMLSEKLPNVDMISFGPNIYNAHSPEEKISVSSIKRTWDFLLEILKNIN